MEQDRKEGKPAKDRETMSNEERKALPRRQGVSMQIQIKAYPDRHIGAGFKSQSFQFIKIYF